MSGLLGGIVKNTQALNTHSQGLQVAGKNLANVNNDAYARQRLTNLTQPATGQKTLQVEQIRDAVLDANVVLQNSETSKLETQASVYQNLQNVLNESLGDDLSATLDSAMSTSETGLHGAFTSFFNAWDALAADPADSAARELVVQQGEYIASLFQGASADLDGVNDDTLTYMQDSVDQANALIENIAMLNGEIVKLENNNTAKAIDLRDSRQQSLEELANYINIKTQEQDDGSITLSISSADSSVNPSADVPLVTGGVVDNLIEINEAIDLTDPANPISTGEYLIQASNGTNLTLSGGGLAGYQEMRNEVTVNADGSVSVNDGYIAELNNRLDLLANEFVEQVNIAYGDTNGDGLLDDTDNNGNPNYFFNPSISEVPADPGPPPVAAIPGVPVTASNISVAVDSGADLVLGVADANGNVSEGDNTYALRVADLKNSESANLEDLSFSDYSLDIVTDLATEVSKNEALLNNEQLASDFIEDQRDSISGVSMDEEVTNLLRYQRSFQASAKVVNTMDQLLDLVVNRLVS